MLPWLIKKRNINLKKYLLYTHYVYRAYGKCV